MKLPCTASWVSPRDRIIAVTSQITRSCQMDSPCPTNIPNPTFCTKESRTELVLKLWGRLSSAKLSIRALCLQPNFFDSHAGSQPRRRFANVCPYWQCHCSECGVRSEEHATFRATCAYLLICLSHQGPERLKAGTTE